MKILTANFVTCAVKACKASPLSFPLHFQDAELEQTDVAYNPVFLRNVLPRLDWEALRTTAAELGFTSLPETMPEHIAIQGGDDDGESAMHTDSATDSNGDSAVWRDLHRLLMETQVIEGKLVCGNCGHEYRIRDGIANFLLPAHLV